MCLVRKKNKSLFFHHFKKIINIIIGELFKLVFCIFAVFIIDGNCSESAVFCAFYTHDNVFKNDAFIGGYTKSFACFEIYVGKAFAAFYVINGYYGVYMMIKISSLES